MQKIAIIKDVHIGNRDIGHPVLWFNAQIPEGYGALQILNWDEAKALIAKSGLHDFTSLNGKPCFVETEGNIIKFLRLADV